MVFKKPYFNNHKKSKEKLQKPSAVKKNTKKPIFTQRVKTLSYWM